MYSTIRFKVPNTLDLVAYDVNDTIQLVLAVQIINHSVVIRYGFPREFTECSINLRYLGL